MYFETSPGDATAPQAASGLPRPAADQEPGPFPGYQRAHDAQHRRRSRPQSGSQRAGRGRQIGNAVEGAEVRQSTIEGQLERADQLL